MLRGKITEIRNEEFEVRFEDGQILVLPLGSLEGEPKPGQELVLAAAALGGEDAGHGRLARHLLNELLKG
jgi:hypothetical protein